MDPLLSFKISDILSAIDYKAFKSQHVNITDLGAITYFRTYSRTKDNDHKESFMDMII